MDKEHKDPYKLDMTQPRLAWYKQKKWRRHQNTVYWVDIQLPQLKRLKFYQTRWNAIILYDTLPAYCILKVIIMDSGAIIYEKVLASPRTPVSSSARTVPIGERKWTDIETEENSSIAYPVSKQWSD